MRSRHHAQAAVVLERAARAEPGKGSILEALGRAYFNSGQHERSQRSRSSGCSRWIRRHRTGTMRLGQSLKRLGRTREARTHLRLAVALDPGSALFRGALARLATRDRRGTRRTDASGGGRGPRADGQDPVRPLDGGLEAVPPVEPERPVVGGLDGQLDDLRAPGAGIRDAPAKEPSPEAVAALGRQDADLADPAGWPAVVVRPQLDLRERDRFRRRAGSGPRGRSRPDRSPGARRRGGRARGSGGAATGGPPRRRSRRRRTPRLDAVRPDRVT